MGGQGQGLPSRSTAMISTACGFGRRGQASAQVVGFASSATSDPTPVCGPGRVRDAGSQRSGAGASTSGPPQVAVGQPATGGDGQQNGVWPQSPPRSWPASRSAVAADAAVAKAGMTPPVAVVAKVGCGDCGVTRVSRSSSLRRAVEASER